MIRQPAYFGVDLHYGGNTVVLRPSLRAAVVVEAMHNGFPELLRKIEEFDTRTVWELISVGAGAIVAADLAAAVSRQPLASFIKAARAALLEFVSALLPEANDTRNKDMRQGKSMPWSEVFGTLYKLATGWLGWTPDAAWNATPQEITDAFEAHVEKLKAIHGAAEDAEETPNEYQQQRNIELGLDPEFDRAGLHSLKAISLKKEGQTL